ncbi:hypothetical protein U1Q18_049980 [Sarracenia purpurea var. burkii]
MRGEEGPATRSGDRIRQPAQAQIGRSRRPGQVRIAEFIDLVNRFTGPEQTVRPSDLALSIRTDPMSIGVAKLGDQPHFLLISLMAARPSTSAKCWVSDLKVGLLQPLRFWPAGMGLV